MDILFTYDARRDASAVHKIRYEILEGGEKKRRYKSIGVIACKEYNCGFNKYQIASKVRHGNRDKLKATIQAEISRFIDLIINKEYTFSFTRECPEEYRKLDAEDIEKINRECKRLNNQYRAVLGEILAEGYEKGPSPFEKRNEELLRAARQDEDASFDTYGYEMPNVMCYDADKTEE